LRSKRSMTRCGPDAMRARVLPRGHAEGRRTAALLRFRSSPDGVRTRARSALLLAVVGLPNLQCPHLPLIGCAFLRSACCTSDKLADLLAKSRSFKRRDLSTIHPQLVIGGGDRGVKLANLMTDLFKLILGVLASLFRSRAKLEAEILVLRQQINVLRRRRRNDRISTIPIVFCSTQNRGRLRGAGHWSCLTWTRLNNEARRFRASRPRLRAHRCQSSERAHHGLLY
jgi:hypothetical protein